MLKTFPNMTFVVKWDVKPPTLTLFNLITYNATEHFNSSLDPRNRTGLTTVKYFYSGSNQKHCIPSITGIKKQQNCDKIILKLYKYHITNYNSYHMINV